MSNLAGQTPHQLRPSVSHAVEGVLDSTQRLLLDRIDLLQLDMLDGVRQLAKEGVLALVAGVFGIVAYIAFTIAFGLFLMRFAQADVAVFVVGLVYALTSVVLILIARAQRRAPTPATESATDGGSAWRTHN